MIANVIPEGYMQDGQGRLVPLDMVKPIDKLRNELVLELVKKADQLNNALEQFKTESFTQIEDFCDLSSGEYDQALGGAKGNVTLMSYDGKFKVVRAVSDLFNFNEQIQTAKQLIDECIKEWSQGSRSELVALVNDAFQTDKQGNVNIKRILSLRKFDIQDPRWQQAMTAISDSLSVTGSRIYLRLYKRIEGTESWQQIPMDLASVGMN